MKKVATQVIVFAGLFCFASFALAVSIPDPLGGATWCSLLKGIANAVAGIVGGISTIMIIVSGIFYLTSAGSPEKIKKAKDTLTYAIIGIVIAILAGGIVTEILTILGGSTSCP